MADMRFDVAVIGGGAAGLMCAGVAGQLGLRVALIEHSARLGEKIRISGGGRCNFTNLHAGPANFHSANPHFCRSALARYTPADFVALVRRHRIDFHEKHKGQLFCDGPATAIVEMLLAECAAGAVRILTDCAVADVGHGALADGTTGFRLATTAGTIEASRLVVATGGLSIPKIGATDFGYRLARQFGLGLVATRPGLVPLSFPAEDWAPYAELSGIGLAARVGVADAPSAAPPGGAKKRGRGAPVPVFDDDLLLTHRGLSGPAILQISSFWTPGQPLTIDLLPGLDVGAALREAKRATPARSLATVLGTWLPSRLASHLTADFQADQGAAANRIGDLADRALDALAQGLADWRITPSGTEGYRKAEVTCGGVDTAGLSSTSMAARAVPGLYFVGEVADVTGWLGGYNFQWAWASAVAAARDMAGQA